METEFITFNGKEYPCRRIDIPNFGPNILVASKELKKALYGENGKCVSAEARAIDFSVIKYVSEEILAKASDETLGDYVRCSF